MDMKKIKNAEVLLGTGDSKSREIVLGILDRTLARMDSYYVLKGMTSLKGKILTIGEKSWDLTQKRNIYLIGAGKAANAMAKVFDELLGAELADGIVVVKIVEEKDKYEHVRMFQGGHPLPNEGSYQASLEVLKMVEEMNEDDLVIGLMSGGNSALLSCPMEGLTLEDEMQTRDVMLKSGASVVEVNAVCRHISRVNGGRLAQAIEAKGAEMICILIMDALGFPATECPGKPREFGFTQMAPDATTLEDAKNAIKNYDVADKLPPKVVEFYQNCTEKDETPKSLKKWTGYIINTLPDVSKVAKEEAEKMGLRTMVLTNALIGESSEAGNFMASIAAEIQASGQPIAPPCVVIATGEVSAKIPEQPKGIGGPGQELAAGFAIAARKLRGPCIASVDTEGTDGPTDSAGGLADSKTFWLSEEKGIDLYEALRNHAVYEALSPLNSEIITGNTGTNLCDLHIMYVPEGEV